jgi:hypothetical protein
VADDDSFDVLCNPARERARVFGGLGSSTGL